MTGLVVPGFWRRLGASVLDRLVGLGVWALSAMWLVLGLWVTRDLPRDLRGTLVLGVSIAILGAFLHAVYQIAFIGGCGQTPGQMAFAIGVVRRDGRPAGYGRAAGRTLGGLLTAMTLGLGSLLALFNRERRGLPDLVAGTRVVRLGPVSARVEERSGGAVGQAHPPGARPQSA